MTKSFNIGDTVSIVSHKDKDGSLCLAFPSTRDELTDCSIDTFLVIGRHQRTGNLALLVSNHHNRGFDPQNYLCDRVNSAWMQNYDINQKYHGERILIVSPKFVFIASDDKQDVKQIHMNEPGGCHCNICKKFLQYAGPNLPNGGMACYSCRTTKRWKVDSYLNSVGIDPDSVIF